MSVSRLCICLAKWFWFVVVGFLYDVYCDGEALVICGPFRAGLTYLSSDIALSKWFVHISALLFLVYSFPVFIQLLLLQFILLFSNFWEYLLIFIVLSTHHLSYTLITSQPLSVYCFYFQFYLYNLVLICSFFVYIYIYIYI